MEIANSQPSKIWRSALIGVALTFAWIALSLIVGLGSGPAQAAEDDDESVLGAVTSLVDSAASTATKAVTTVTTPVAPVVNTAVAVAPTPVQKAAQHAVAAVGSTVSSVAQPVADAAASGAVSAAAKPVVDTVSRVPVVGDIATDVGVDAAVESLSGSVDDTLAGVTRSVVNTAAGLGRAPASSETELPDLLPDWNPCGHGVARSPASPDAATIGLIDWSGEASAPFSSSLASLPGAVPPAPGAVAWAAPADAGGPLSPAGGLCPPAVASSGPGGAGSGAWALVALGPFAALRAWGRRAGPEDDRVPAAPAGYTDVSPD